MSDTNTRLIKQWRVMGEDLENEYMFLKRNDIPFRMYYRFMDPANNYYEEDEGDAFDITTETVEQETMLKLFFGERLHLLILFNVGAQSWAHLDTRGLL